ncbi:MULTISPECIES: DUF3718 domain-containing protein [unclassified Colwellia]|uniref:DUF3718 domain-containing protein n=1 Tax=unclassified Colwellia TaxID=196834 RepID=UPI0015F3884C|nr:MULTISPECIES: DUF3718 domain-containing protein [unclassified Colwellia]MBA6230991.1 DUF3718 domain-containing protein [Colwellia sp. MB02u-7]MBA6234922.1 DUF3718 domain-containing protein [Colwellia sp. MB02u-11]MBA6255786.1 DUF3718 domain-containing protein [Colwellia sp. MB3u-28]MBA6261927.1 DUF3718 domain-containing protein [Colwellia sp. MB3u-41]MBA6301477.1 DUF3718 domain-containing protein [Colwellia sp. MB3u-22]
MKKTLLVASLIAASVTFAPVTKADNMSLRICEYIAANDKNRLRSFMKQNKLKIRTLFKNIECNGQNLLVFAASNNALETGEFLIGKVPAKKVAEHIAEIGKYSKHLEEEAKDRVN